MLRGATAAAAALPLSSPSSSSSAAAAAFPRRLVVVAPPSSSSVPRRVVAARRLLSALSRGGDDDADDADDDPDLEPYLWRCSGVPSPPPAAWRALEQAATAAAAARTTATTTTMPPALLPLLAAPPSALLPERAVLRWHDATAAGSDRRRCQLSRRGLLAPLRDRALEEFLARLFEAAVVGRRRRRREDDARTAATAAKAAAAPPRPTPPPEVGLSRYDLFHAHLFAASDGVGEDRALRLGLLFHAAEYPQQQRVEAAAAAQEDGAGERRAGAPPSSAFPLFPHDLGRCQRGSDLAATPERLEWRNIAYFAGALAAFSVARGGPLRPLLRPGTAPLATVYEEDLALPPRGGGGGGPGGWVGPDVMCFRARDVVEPRMYGALGRPDGDGSNPKPRAPSPWPRRRRTTMTLPPPVETASLGPLHVFLSG
jgi:hypothetical protein